MAYLGDEEVNLAKYQCAKCGKRPETSQEVFRGCQCGHRLFRIVSSYTKPMTQSGLRKNAQKEDLEFLTVRERSIGVYDINVGQLLPQNSKQKTPMIAGNEGVFTIQLDSKKKK
ncbi:MAG: hypothetical protein EAX86_04595 [Candidatus Heimdallarchaeota archaeon]|nr:hypothetical protein [Candidatus Heimdallarchaeota archaeon]